jgi:hypothetical protein
MVHSAAAGGVVTTKITTKWASHATPADIKRLRTMPTHKVHETTLAKMKGVFGAFKTQRRVPPEFYHGDGMAVSDHNAGGGTQLMLLTSASVVQAYLMYHRPREDLVVVECVYSPFPKRGHASTLLSALEGQCGGQAIAFMATPDTLGFFTARGYRTLVGGATGLGQLLVLKYIVDPL